MSSLGGITGSSISALMREYEITANNIANLNTAGYKRKVSAFSRQLQEHLDPADKANATRGEIELKDQFDLSQGALVCTERKLDLAICGQGYFTIETPQGLRFSRNGVFHIDARTRQLVDTKGEIVAGVGAPIIFPEDINETEVNITSDGVVTARGNQIGRIRFVDFGDDNNKLLPVGGNMLKAPQDLEETVQSQNQAYQPAKSYLRQGYQERSNVKMMDETVNMMSMSRLYQMNLDILKRFRENSRAMIDVAKSG